MELKTVLSGKTQEQFLKLLPAESQCICPANKRVYLSYLWEAGSSRGNIQVATQAVKLLKQLTVLTY